MAQEKSRYAAFLVYEESAAEDWKKTLKSSHGMYAVSPLHEPDDEVLKPHRHVLYMHGSPVSFNALRNAIPRGVAANEHIEIVHHPRQYQRYLIHLDDPEKQQFQGGADAIELLNGFPLDLSRELSRAEQHKIRAGVFDFIRDNDVIEYSDLIDLLTDNGFVDELDYACTHTILYNSYLASRRASQEYGD